MNNKDIFDKKTYDYNLPDNLIAQKPVYPRDNSRLLVYNKESEKISHKRFFNIVDYLQKGDVLVINSTKVLPARLFGNKKETNAKIEILLLKRIKLDNWEILVKPSKRVKPGSVIKFSDTLECTIEKKLEDGIAIVNFSYKGVFEQEIEKVGDMPLPHYIKERLRESKRYQTVYAKKTGSSAAPTAGLHFTDELLEKIRKKGVKVVEIILHVGLGTFRPVKTDNIKNHKMHSEYYEISDQTAKTINQAKKAGKNIVAVGTTVIRALESACQKDYVESEAKETDIFIYPGYKFQVIDKVITNFHLPQSTLIMLISAFIGIDKTMHIYKTAVSEKYRFFSFGDAMLIEEHVYLYI